MNHGNEDYSKLLEEVRKYVKSFFNDITMSCNSNNWFFIFSKLALLPVLFNISINAVIDLSIFSIYLVSLFLHLLIKSSTSLDSSDLMLLTY